MKKKKLKQTNAGLKKENQALRMSLLQEKEANQMKSTFLSHISHDIRTPVSGIDGMANIAVKHIDDKDRVLDCLDKIEKASQYLLSLLNNVLDISRIESGKMIISYELMDIRELINSCVCITEGLLMLKDVDFIKSFGIFRHPVVIGDALHLRRVLINILSNAAKFTPDGGEIFFHVSEISADNKKVTYCFEIEDTGIGMKPEFLEQIWDSFTQENNRNLSGVNGSGLGMAVTKKLVDLMDGTIYVESEQGVGSKFIVKIAFGIGVVSDFSEKQKKMEERDKQQILLKGRKVLLVEDQPINLEITKCMLEDIGIDVITAGDGQTAVNIFNNCADGTFDAVIMDVRMPVLDGLSAAGKIRTLPKSDASSIPIIALTADTCKEDIKKTAEAGMNACLTKPVNQEELILILNNFCLKKKDMA